MGPALNTGPIVKSGGNLLRPNLLKTFKKKVQLKTKNWKAVKMISVSSKREKEIETGNKRKSEDDCYSSSSEGTVTGDDDDYYKELKINASEAKGIYQAIYVEDFIEAAQQLQCISQQNTRILDGHSRQLNLLKRLSAEMACLLGEDDKDDLIPSNLRKEKQSALANLERLLIASSEIGDDGIKASEAIEEIVLEKLEMLRIDYNNLADETSKHDPNNKSNACKINAANNKAKMMKKPSINPERLGTGQRGTPIKNITPAGNIVDVPGSETDGNSISSPGSLKSCPKSQSSTFLDCLRTEGGSQSSTMSAHVRTCKLKNPPNYVINYRTYKKPSTSEENLNKKANQPAGEGLKQKSGKADTEAPLYCICKQESKGWMVECDNESCEIQWFHFKCIGLKSPPKGKWYCSACCQTLGGESVKSKDVNDLDNKDEEEDNRK